ncbi:MAG: archaeal heat shock protein Hsp20 [Candidatus Njordarchaeia archaeon]
MDDDRDRRRRDRWDEDPFDRFFRDFFGSRSPFDEFFRDIQRIMRRWMRDLEEFDITIPREFFDEKKFPKTKSYVYGFSVTIGPDGKPIIKEFGNVKPTMMGVVSKDQWEPISTVIPEKDKIRIIVDIPGAKKESIKIDATSKNVEIRAESDDRSFYKKIDLPEEVDPESAKAKYNNGVLEIVFDKKVKEEKKKEIKVE